jgi:GDP-L-fucose synthase
MEKNSKIYVAGHKGMAGSAIVRGLKAQGFTNLLVQESKSLDLRDQASVANFFKKEKPDVVFLAAAKVGGIYANNTYRAEFIYDNIMIQSNVIHQAYENNVSKLLFLGSSCIYPKIAPQPLKEEYILTGALEPTNEPYAIAKIAGVKMCEAYKSQYGKDFIAVMPTNLYGPNDNYNPMNSHVFGALLRRFHEAKENKEERVVVWGTGTPQREFLHVDDLADACIFLMQHYSGSDIINIGSGEEVTILELANIMKKVVGYEGELIFDKEKPDGTPRKRLDTTRLFNMGWNPRIGLKEGVAITYEDFKENRQRYILR